MRHGNKGEGTYADTCRDILDVQMRESQDNIVVTVTRDILEECRRCRFRLVVAVAVAVAFDGLTAVNGLADDASDS